MRITHGRKDVAGAPLTNISQNKSPAIGTLLTYNLSESFSLTHSTFLGNEEGTRFFNDFYLKGKLSDDSEFVAAFDCGYQNKAGTPAWWSGSSAVVRKRLSDALAVSLRAEHFSDHNGIVATAIAPGRPFSVRGLSVGIDVTPVERLLFRAEYRPVRGSTPIFPRDEGFAEKSHLLVVSVTTWMDGISPS